MEIALITVLGCIATSLAYLLFARLRGKSKRGSATHPMTVVNGSVTEANARQVGTMTHQTEVAKHLSEPCTEAGGEALTPDKQISGSYEHVKIISTKPHTTIPAELSTHEGQIDFPEKQSGTQGTESESILQIDEGRQEPEAEGELLDEQTIDVEHKTDISEPIRPTEEVKPPAKEQKPSGDRIKEDVLAGVHETRGLLVEGADGPISGADDAEIKTPDRKETESKLDVNRQANDRRSGAEEEESASTMTGQESQRRPARETIPEDIRVDHERLPVDGKVMQDGTEVRQLKKSKTKTKRKNILQQHPSQSRAQLEFEEEKRLLAEVVEILEGRKLPEDRTRQQLPSRYKPPSLEPLGTPQPLAKRRSAGREHQKALTLNVRLVFDRNEHCRVGLLPQRETDLPEEIELGEGDDKLTVTAIHDAWYEDVYPENLAELLGIGISWVGFDESGIIGSWRLSGRDIYVLAKGELKGYLQTTRLRIGRNHVVLCKNSLLQETESILLKAGCKDLTRLSESYGAPVGWTVIRGVAPTDVVRVENGPEILSILQPIPELEIDLQGGIYLRQSTWLKGFPPNICVLGDKGTEIEAFIDGSKAVAGDGGSLRHEGYDNVGEHRVSIPLASISRIYRIYESDEEWPPWDAYDLGRFNLCGPLLRAIDTKDTPRVVAVPSCNSVIIGAKPGDISWCPPICGPKQISCVTFHPVWALPRDAFGCNKKVTRIMLLDAKPLDQVRNCEFTRKDASRVLAWSNAILNASRKGLYLDSSDAQTALLWREYKAHARFLWKMLKP